MIYRLIFIILWPLLWFVLPLTRRVRVLIVDKNKILLVKNRIGVDRWGLPGGGIKFGESIEDAAKREIQEELDIEINNISILNKKAIIHSQYGLTLRQHFVTAKINKDANIKDNWEIDEYDWKEIGDVENGLKEIEIAINLVDRR